MNCHIEISSLSSCPEPVHSPSQISSHLTEILTRNLVKKVVQPLNTETVARSREVLNDHISPAVSWRRSLLNPVSVVELEALRQEDRGAQGVAASPSAGVRSEKGVDLLLS